MHANVNDSASNPGCLCKLLKNSPGIFFCPSQFFHKGLIYWYQYGMIQAANQERSAAQQGTQTCL